MMAGQGALKLQRKVDHEDRPCGEIRIRSYRALRPSPRQRHIMRTRRIAADTHRDTRALRRCVERGRERNQDRASRIMRHHTAARPPARHRKVARVQPARTALAHR